MLNTKDYLDVTLSEFEQKLLSLNENFKKQSRTIQDIDFRLFDYADKFKTFKAQQKVIEEKQIDLINSISNLESKQDAMDDLLLSIESNIKQKYLYYDISRSDNMVQKEGKKLNEAMQDLELSLTDLIKKVDEIERTSSTAELVRLLRHVEVHEKIIAKTSHQLASLNSKN